jgi:hypothetical protein
VQLPQPSEIRAARGAVYNVIRALAFVEPVGEIYAVLDLHPVEHLLVFNSALGR